MWSTPLKFMGLFHIMGYIVEIAFLVLGGMLGAKQKVSDKSKEKTLRLALFVLLCLEVFKQIFLTVSNGYYDWSKFPLQICSIPMFMLLIFTLVKSKRIKEACLGFAGVPTILFGFFYFIKATAALESPYILISFQSFAWHWMISAIAMYIVIAYDVLGKGGFRKYIVSGYCIWAAFAVVAAIIDRLTFASNPAINFFYIGYGQKPFYPIITAIFKSSTPYIPYFLFFLLYIALGILAMYGICFGVAALVGKKKKA